MVEQSPVVIDAKLLETLRGALCVERLVETAVALIEIPSPTRSARAVADRLGELLTRDRFEVERPAAGWPESPAVVARLSGPAPGKTLQFDGHLDTVHLPFVPPSVTDGTLRGSGAADMKGGVAAMVEALRMLRDAQTLDTGEVLVTAHDLHESPWGDGRQLEGLIDAGYRGDAVLLPEYLDDRVPIIGRGLMVLEISIRRDGVPVHEVLGGLDQPSVIQAGARLVEELGRFDRELARRTHPLAGRESLFVGSVAAGEIYNQSPVEFRLSGTRRWLPGRSLDEVRAELQNVLARVEANSGTRFDGRFHLTRQPFAIDPADPLVEAFQAAHAAVTGRTLPLGAKPFVDDGNTFWARGGIPSITHGPGGTGAHTLNEEVSVADLARTALVYAVAAVAYCGRR